MDNWGERAKAKKKLKTPRDLHDSSWLVLKYGALDPPRQLVLHGVQSLGLAGQIYAGTDYRYLPLCMVGLV